jgi:protein-tyrosine phosphatase
MRLTSSCLICSWFVIQNAAAFVATKRLVLIRSFCVVNHAVGVNSNDNDHDSIYDKEFVEPRLTPKTDIPHNFGPISTTRSNQILFTAECPGHETLVGGVSKEVVDEWVAFMTTNGMKHVLVLLDANEMDHYPEPGLLKLYETGGMQPHVVPMGSKGAYSQIMSILQGIEQKNEKAVTHCTGGVGRAGRVAAAWLSTRYNLTPQEATQEAVEAALQAGIQRLGDAAKLDAWMKI